jgi:hypothetical protein
MLAEISTIQEVWISRLQNSPMQVTLHSAKTIEQISDAAKDPQQRESFAPIRVALLKDSMFIIDGHAVVEGFRLANITTIRAILYHVESINDVLVLHAKFNQHSPMNPFELMDLINFMIECGESPEQIRQRLQLREHLSKLIGCQIANQEAKNRLKNFIHDLSVKYSNVVIPPYFAELVSKVPERIQLEVVEQFISIMDQTLPDRKFAFPGPETLEVYFRQYLKNREREPIFFRHEVMHKEDGKAHKTYAVSLSKKETRLAGQVIGSIPGMALLKVESPGLYRVDLIKKIIAPIREKYNLTVIEGDDGRKIFSLPQSATEFLDLKDDSDAENVLVKELTVLQLKKFASRLADKDSRFVLIADTRSLCKSQNKSD